MSNEPIYELLKPGDVLILYKEETGSYVCVTNKDGDLSIERAFVPPSNVVPSNIVLCTAGEDIEPGDLVTFESDGKAYKSKPVVSGSYRFSSKDKSNTISKDDMRAMAKDICDMFCPKGTDSKDSSWPLKAGFDDAGNPIVTCGPSKKSKQKLEEWVNKCNDQKMQLWTGKEEDLHRSLYGSAAFKECLDCERRERDRNKRKEARAQRVKDRIAKKSLNELLDECKACGLCLGFNKL